MQTPPSSLTDRVQKNTDWLVGAALFVFTFLIYLRTLAPSVAYLFDDSLEFQLLAARMAIAHPTGYPLYSLLIKLATFLPVGDVAFRVNLVSALCAAGAVAFVYLAARVLTARFVSANNMAGELLLRAPALLAALVLAFGGTFWSQAVIAEVYALQAFLTALMMWLVLRWGARNENATGSDYKPLIAIAFFAGLMLTHHRMSVLLLPALIVYALSYDRALLRQPKQLAILLGVFLLPLLLYLYLPIRGMVTSSLDGAYENTPTGFLNWILGTAYTVFVTQDPLSQTRDTGYYVELLLNDQSAVGLLMALVGLVLLFFRAWKEWLLFMLALGANLAFVLTYHVADINVFFIPTYVLLALLTGAGLTGLMWLAFDILSPRAALIVVGIGAVVALLVPYALYREHYARVDLSNKTDVLAYGREMLAQPLPENSTIIGILGEMTLLNYLQETQGIRPDVETIAADKEEDRLNAIEEALGRGREVFLTRPLRDVASAHALTSRGPLVAVQNKANRGKAPTPAQPLDQDFGSVKLLGYDLSTEGEPPRVTLYWQPQEKLGVRLISLKLLDANGKLGGQLDRHPVLDAYRTNEWRSGEYITDTYELPIFVGAAPGEYILQVTMYDPDSGEVFGQRELGRVTVGAQTSTIPREMLDVAHVALKNIGGLELTGFDLDTTESYAPGAHIPLTLLWRLARNGTMREYEISVEDGFGKNIARQTASVGGETTAEGQYVRQDLQVDLPSMLGSGMYTIRVTVPGGLPPILESNTYALGGVEVQTP